MVHDLMLSKQINHTQHLRVPKRSEGQALAKSAVTKEFISLFVCTCVRVCVCVCMYTCVLLGG